MLKIFAEFHPLQVLLYLIFQTVFCICAKQRLKDYSLIKSEEVLHNNEF